MVTPPASAAAAVGDVQRAVAAIPDPEIPVLTIEELGILRDVRMTDDSVVEIDITPTYSGCPALDGIRADVERTVRGLGLTASVNVVLSPAWSTDWMSDAARQKLREHGVAPPRHRMSTGGLLELAVVCPVCGSAHTDEVAHFAATPCQALRRCEGCHEPFQHFKEH